jgi:hypothetical protein
VSGKCSAAAVYVTFTTICCVDGSKLKGYLGCVSSFHPKKI